MEKVLTKEEIEKIKQIRDQIQEVIFTLGEIEIQISELKENKIKIQDKFKDLKIEQQKLISEFTTKFGVGVINLETGIFTTN